MAALSSATAIIPKSEWSDTRWTFEQDKLFEQALALYEDADADDDEEDEDEDEEEDGGGAVGRWEKVAAMVPGKSMAEVKKHYDLLLEDLASIEAGRIALPNYYNCASPTTTTATTTTWEDKLKKSGATALCNYAKGCAAKPSEQERKKGIPWTEDEHRLFLLGLDKFGKGDWRSISRNFVVSRTPTQVASHAQKYFIRLNSINKDKRRSSIHDITTSSSSSSSPSSSTAAAVVAADSSSSSQQQRRPSSSPAPLVPAVVAPPPPSSILLAQPPSLSRPPLYIPPVAIAPTLGSPLHLSPYHTPRPPPHLPRLSLMSGSVSPSHLAFSPHSAMHHHQ